MAKSLGPEAYYNSTTNPVTTVGRRLLRRYFAHTYSPNDMQLTEIEEITGCEKKKLKVKFARMRNRDNAKLVALVKSNVSSTCLAGSSSQSTPTETQEPSRAVEFLNNISVAQTKELRKIIRKRSRCEKLINAVHVDEEIAVEEIVALTCVTSKDGVFFEDWMSCHINAADLQKPPLNYPFRSIRSGNRVYKYAQPELSYCLSKNIETIFMFKHHIMLRSKGHVLPTMACTKTGQSASHLCDTKGCVRPSHIIIESFAVNINRRSCGGVILVLKNMGPSKPNKILQIDPCIHGINHPGVDEQVLV